MVHQSPKRLVCSKQMFMTIRQVISPNSYGVDKDEHDEYEHEGPDERVDKDVDEYEENEEEHEQLAAAARKYESALIPNRNGQNMNTETK